MDEFASRSWRVEGVNTLAERHGHAGKWALVMKYRTSNTHMGKFASKPFRSSDERYGRLWDSKEEALRPENVQPFRDFVQVRSVCERVRSACEAPRPMPHLTATWNGERPPVRSARCARLMCVPCRVPRQIGWATGGGSASKPKREREYNEECQVFINRVPPKLRARVASVAAQSAELIKAQAAKAAARMARLAGLLTGKRKNLLFRRGAVQRPARKEQRKEQQALENAHKQLARSEYRQEQIAILTHAVQNGSCSDMLVPLEDDLNVGSDVSRAQAKRALIQCMVVLEFFRLLEARAEENGGELPGGAVYDLAAQAGMLHRSPR
eukprot:7384310-Prymnesium_polylepis.1